MIPETSRHHLPLVSKTLIFVQGLDLDILCPYGVLFLAVLGYVDLRDFTSLHWPYHHLPVNTSNSTNKYCL